MLQLSKLIIFIVIFVFSFQNLFAADIPIIVIAPSKKAQSISTVGSTTTVFDESSINNTNDFFLGDVLGNRTARANVFWILGAGRGAGPGGNHSTLHLTHPKITTGGSRDAKTHKATPASALIGIPSRKKASVSMHGQPLTSSCVALDRTHPMQSLRVTDLLDVDPYEYRRKLIRPASARPNA